MCLLLAFCRRSHLLDLPNSAGKAVARIRVKTGTSAVTSAVMM